MKNLVKLIAALAVLAGIVAVILKYSDKLKELLDQCCLCRKTCTKTVPAATQKPEETEKATEPEASETPAEEEPEDAEVTVEITLAKDAQETEEAEEAAEAEETEAEDEDAVQDIAVEVTPEDFAD